MNHLAGARARAYLVDGALYLGIAALELPLGLAAIRFGWSSNRTWVHAASAVAPIVAAVVAARAEAGPHEATIGKRREHLKVVAVSPRGRELRISTASGLVRNFVKITVPWQLGHVVALGASRGGFEEGDPPTLVSSALVYPLLGVMAWTGLRGNGRALHDRAARTRVVSTLQ
ncbi:MAG: RDD family protein [Ornithinimicrobium sp.]